MRQWFCMCRVLWLGLLLLISLPVQPETVPPRMTVETPRPFGYTIGDIIHQRLHIELQPGGQLRSDSLPQEGALNHWLELQTVTLQEHLSESSSRYTVDLRYQVFYAPQAVKTLALPRIALIAEYKGEVSEWAVDPWYFTVSPIRDLAVQSSDGGKYRRPDQPPVLFSTRASQLRLIGLALTLLVMTALWSYYFGYLPYSQHKPMFKRACRQLRRLAAEPDTPERAECALKTVHTAFNSLYQQPLFMEQLPDFFAAHPDYSYPRSEIEHFFEASAAFFFAEQGADVITIETLLSLCRQCQRIEQGRGKR